MIGVFLFQKCACTGILMYMSTISHTAESTETLFTVLKTRESGLTAAEAAKRLAENGPNVITAHEISWFSILVRQVKSPFVYILVATAVLATILGQVSDGVIVLMFVLVNIGISFFQEYHSAQSLKLLSRYINPHARVRRGGKESLVDAALLVPGDIVIVETGDIIDADIRLFEAVGLSVNESVLSGESSPASKTGDAQKVEARDIGEAVNMAYSGTTVTGGRGVGVVVATGKDTSIGQIAKLTVETEHLSAFESSIRMFAQFIMKMVSVILVILLVVNIVIKGTHNFVELLLFAVALAISVIPEALPMVTTLSLSKGALKLAQDHVVVKRLSAVEDLGSIEVLCTDKTGTLTENRLTVSSMNAADASECLGYAGLASNERIMADEEPADAFDLAVFQKMTRPEREALSTYERITSIPFDPNRRRVTVAVKHADSDKPEVVVRGAPETILALTTLSKDEVEKVMEWVRTEGAAGRRTLAVAKGACIHPKACEKDEKKLAYVGCISFVDPIKTTTKAAIQEAERLGVSIVILTGDGADVAGAVAYEVGIVTDPKKVITEAEFMALGPVEQTAAVHEYAVFARMSPAGKYRVIEILSNDKSVGYLGDGINDAPALKIASVGLVVANASDIARDAADVVLLNRSLHVIIGGIKSGRAVFENTVKYLKTTLISSFGNFYTIAIAQLILPYLPMLPIQILLLNLLTDYPMLAIATDTVDPHDVRKPHRYNVRDIVLISIVLGLVSTLFDFIFFATFFHAAPATLETNWFIASVLTELVLLYAIRTRQPFWKAKRPSTWLLCLSGTAVIAAIGLPFTSFGKSFFKFVNPTWGHIGLIALIVIVYLIVSEAIKLAYYKFWNHNEEDAPAIRHR
jgi:Mg2+-importing ATPase